jgi:hypothetical protein
MKAICCGIRVYRFREKKNHQRKMAEFPDHLKSNQARRER